MAGSNSKVQNHISRSRVALHVDVMSSGLEIQSISCYINCYAVKIRNTASSLQIITLRGISVTNALNMLSYILLVLVLGASAYGIPKTRNQVVKDELNAISPSFILMPGPVLLPGNRNQLPLDSKNSPYCTLCNLVVSEVDFMLKKHSTEEEIKDELYKLCSVAPAISAQCRKFVDNYLHPIVQALDLMPPQIVCQELGLCKKRAEIQVVKAMDEVDATKITPQCALCQMVVKELDRALSKNSTKKQIEEALSRVCASLPRSYKDKCNKYVEKYAQAIIDILVNEFSSPDKICSALNLCASPRQIKKDNMVKITPCDLCMSVMTVAKKLVEENATEADIERMLKLICWYMIPVRQECSNFIDRTVPLVFDELKKLDPKAICEQLKLCPSGFLPKDARCYMKERNICDNRRLAQKCRIEPYCKVVERV